MILPDGFLPEKIVSDCRKKVNALTFRRINGIIRRNTENDCPDLTPGVQTGISPEITGMNRSQKKKIQKIRKSRRAIMMAEIAVAVLAIAAAIIVLVVTEKKKNEKPADSLTSLSENLTEEMTAETPATTEPETTTIAPETTTAEPETSEEPTETTTEQETDEDGNPVISFTIEPTGQSEADVTSTAPDSTETPSEPGSESGDPENTDETDSDAKDGTESDSETDTDDSEESDSESESEDVSESDAEDKSESESGSDTEDGSESETESTDEKLEGPDYSQVVFIGDSRTLTMGTGGELAFDLVPMDSIAATWGGQLTDGSAYENITNAALKTRKKAVFWYGINDVQLNPERDNPEVFIANYDRLISTYLTMYDSSTVYILSILPTTVREKDYYEGQDENIAAYNQALQTYAYDHNYVFLDLTPLFTGDECFSEGDNIHFADWWYKERFLPAVTRAIGIVY